MRMSLLLTARFGKCIYRSVTGVVLLLAVGGACAADSLLLPQVANPGFEGESLQGWSWLAHGAKASYKSDTVSPHSGARCVLFSNESELEPEVYARLHQTVRVLPGTDYELSLWVRGEDVGGGIHLTDWSSYQMFLPQGSYGWQKVTHTVRTRNDQYQLNLGINLVNRCKALCLDDITLRPLGTPFQAEGIDGTLLVAGRVTGDNTPSRLGVYVHQLRDEDTTFSAEICDDTRVLFEKQTLLHEGDNAFEWEWNTSDTQSRQLHCRVTCSDSRGQVLTSASKTIEKLGSWISRDLTAIEGRLKEFDELLSQCKERGMAVDYPAVARTMLAQFIPLTREDIQRGELQRADFAIKDFHRCLDEALTELRAYLKDPSLAPYVVRVNVPKEGGKPGVRVVRGSFIGERFDSKGYTTRGPVFFGGYGHFFQIRKDLERFPGYGVNIIQAELGPRDVLTSESQVSLEPVEEMSKLLDRAADNNIMVNVLLSPHYFPPWALAKYPELAKGGGGFLGYCVDAPEAKAIIEKYLRTVIPVLRGKPALHSFCLSNEPIFDRAAACPNTRELWTHYLERVHGDVQTLNARYGTNYPALSQVPVPANDAYDNPVFYDFCVFNQERFAAWHKWMADIVHELAPEVPVHAKTMSMALTWRHTIGWGVDPERFGELSQISGNDCLTWPQAQGESGAWSMSWQTQNMSYDLQRSLAEQPIFNSENHLVPDRSTYYVPPEHFRTALWQEAVHGQGATTIWVWEHAFDHASDLYGNVMDRPGCAQAVGQTTLDMNRFAEELTSLQRVKAPVAILYSVASIAKSGAYLPAVERAYTALNFCGVKVDFVSEKQLAAGKGSSYRMLVLPEAANVTSQSLEALEELSGQVRLVWMGESVTKDPYGKRFDASRVEKLRSGALLVDKSTTDPKELWGLLRGELGKLGALPEITVVDAPTSQPVWGVEWLPVTMGGRGYVNMVNLTREPLNVAICLRGKEVSATDVLCRTARPKAAKLDPLVPVLAGF